MSGEPGLGTHESLYCKPSLFLNGVIPKGLFEGGLLASAAFFLASGSLEKSGLR